MNARTLFGELHPISGEHRAPCRDNPDAWFPKSISGRAAATYDIWAECRPVCEACPLRAECLELALNEERGSLRYGMRGGKTPSQRRRIAEQRARQARAA